MIEADGLCAKHVGQANASLAAPQIGPHDHAETLIGGAALPAQTAPSPFGGKAWVEIPPGKDAWSDAAPLPFVPVDDALHRPNLFLGGERELALITAIACAGVGVSSLTVFGAVASLLVWSLCIGLFRLMAKSDVFLSALIRSPRPC
jgi:type IV secretory pathway TrbD component